MVYLPSCVTRIMGPAKDDPVQGGLLSSGLYWVGSGATAEGGGLMCG